MDQARILIKYGLYLIEVYLVYLYTIQNRYYYYYYKIRVLSLKLS